MIEKTITVRRITLGAGRPAVCIPVTGNSESEILNGMRKALANGADLIEWRADFYDDVFESEKLSALLRRIRVLIEDTVLLFTFRTKQEGGNCAITPAQYAQLNHLVMKSGMVDLIDVEINRDSADYPIRKMIQDAHLSNVKVIVSKHDFEKTPADEEMHAYINEAGRLSADIVKLAVMPQNMDDVLRLLKVTNTCSSEEDVRPLITMSMGPLGSVSRAVGEYVGSIVTFGAAGTGSAPGQLEVNQLKTVLDVLHQALGKGQ